MAMYSVAGPRRADKQASLNKDGWKQFKADHDLGTISNGAFIPKNPKSVSKVYAPCKSNIKSHHVQFCKRYLNWYCAAKQTLNSLRWEQDVQKISGGRL